jgi:hypothetical protein
MPRRSSPQAKRKPIILGKPMSIYSTPDHCAVTQRGIEVCITHDETGVVNRVAIINDGEREMIELEPTTALAIAKSLVVALEGRIGKPISALH